jgi:hypothetical protein
MAVDDAEHRPGTGLGRVVQQAPEEAEEAGGGQRAAQHGKPQRSLGGDR